MASTSSRVPVPLPVNGVQSGVNQRIVGHSGLVESENWIYRQGKFSVRKGLVPLTFEDGFPLAGVYNEIAEYPYVVDHDNFDGLAMLDVDYQFSTYETPWPETKGDIATLTNGPIDLYDLLNGSHLGAAWASGDGYDEGNPTEASMEGWWHTGAPRSDTIVTSGNSINGWQGNNGNTTWQMKAAVLTRTDSWWDGSTAITYIESNYSDPPASPYGNVQCQLHTPFIPIGTLGDRYQFQVGVSLEGSAGTAKIKPFVVEYFGFDSSGRHRWGEVEYLGRTGTATVDAVHTIETIPRIDAILPLNSTATHMGFTLELDCPADIIVISEAQINWLGGDLDDLGWHSFYAPSSGSQLPATGAVSIFERPVGFRQFVVESGEDIKTVVGTTDGWYDMESDSTWTDITGSSALNGNSSSQVVFRTLDTTNPDGTGSSGMHIVGVNGTDSVKWWDGAAATYSDLLQGGSGSSTDELIAKTVAVNANRIVYGNIQVNPSGAGWTHFPDAIIYSEFLEVNDWAYADIIRLGETAGDVVAMLEMGNNVTAIYKTDAVYMLTSTGGSIPFRLDLKEAHIKGPASPTSVVSIEGGMHCYMSSDGDIIIFDGVRTSSIGQHIHAYLQDNVDFFNIAQTFGIYDKARKEVTFFFKGMNDTDNYSGVVISLTNPQMPTLWPMKYQIPISTGGFTYRDSSITIDQLAGRTIDSLTQPIDSFAVYEPSRILMSAEPADDSLGEENPEGVAYIDSLPYDFQGPISYSLRTGLSDFGALASYKTIKEIDHLFRKAGDEEIEVAVWGSHAGEEPETSDVDDVDLSDWLHQSQHTSTYRLFSIGLSGTTSHPVEWMGSEASVETRGLR